MKLSKITFTGIDDYTEMKRVESLSKEYPYAEFGLLVSKDWLENGTRFPDPEIIWDLAKMWSNHPVPLSCHLCGSLAKEAAYGDFSNVFSLVPAELFRISKEAVLQECLTCWTLPVGVVLTVLYPFLMLHTFISAMLEALVRIM